jgi:GNAT superfamily N-acetyltransferase
LCVPAYLNSPNHLVLLAIREQPVAVLIGSYRIDIDYECRAGLVDAIVVADSMRKQGIGTALVRGFTPWARDRDCTLDYHSWVSVVGYGNAACAVGIGIELDVYGSGSSGAGRTP